MIRLGGDRVERGDVELFKKHFSRDCVLFVGYGATECKIITQLFVNHDSRLDDGVLPVGYPAHDMEILIYKDGCPVGPGEAGEIVIRSRYLAPGYWRQPELTAQRFLPDPDGHGLPEEQRKRLYLSGDVGRLAEDGCLTHLGRKDSQVKIRGFRVETTEVEAVLLERPSVKEAVVVAREGLSGNLQLVAYIVPTGTSQITGVGLRRELAEHLPDYMIPSAFVVMDALPLNANGKIDRRALPQPETTRPDLEYPYVAPQDELESELVALWEELLGVCPIGVRDSFYDLGGNSLLVARLFAQVEARFNGAECKDVPVRYDMPLKPFFRLPTVERLADICRQWSAGDPSRSVRNDQTSRPRNYRKPSLRAWLVALKNRLLQAIALYAPGATSTRVRLHRLRGVRIGRGVFVGLGVILESEFPHMVSIGNSVTLSVRSVVIAHFAGSARWARISGGASVRIEDHAFIGPGVIILPNVTVGHGAVVAAGSIVSQSVPPLTMVQGNPAKPVARCGIPLVGNTYEQFVRNLKPLDESVDQDTVPADFRLMAGVGK
jgi:acetyltransferase-like isoleucine patch superfamily enzyme